MAKYKQGVDYFPLDVFLDDKFKFIEIKFNLEGFAIVIKLLQKIYSCGYWYKWTEDEVLLFADEVKVKKELIADVVDECLKRDIFSQRLYDKYQMLTSKGIQKRYKEIVRRRRDVEWHAEYLLIDGINTVSDDTIPTQCQLDADTMTTLRRHDADISEQSKVNRKETETEKNDLLQIKNLRSRYSDNELKVIDNYFDILRWTRKNGKIANSVTTKIYQEWGKFPIKKVIYGLKVYIENPKHHDKKEQYCYGIMRNAKAEEVENNSGRNTSIYPEL